MLAGPDGNLINSTLSLDLFAVYRTLITATNCVQHSATSGALYERCSSTSAYPFLVSWMAIPLRLSSDEGFPDLSSQPGPFTWDMNIPAVT